MSDGPVVPVSNGVASFFLSAWEGTGWPHVAIIFGVVFLLLFRVQIKILLLKVKSVGKSGITMGPELTPVQPEASDSPDLSSQVVTTNTDHLKQYPIALAVQKGCIHTELKTVSPEQTVEYLTDNLAFARTLWYFENTFTVIYGGQISFLKILNDRQGVGLAKADLDGLWTQHQAKLAPALDLWNGTVYLSFLYARGFIADQGSVVMITATGVEFLMWMIKVGRSEANRGF